MTATVQLNTRIDPELKRRGDAVFARAGLSSSEVVRAVWLNAAQTQKVPDCIIPDSARPSRTSAIREGRGLACSIMQGLGLGIEPRFTEQTREAERDEYYDEMLANMEASHA